jgi:hypothetical protein
MLMIEGVEFMAAKKSKLAQRASELEDAVTRLFTGATPVKKKKRRTAKKAKVVKKAKKAVKAVKKAVKKAKRKAKKKS